MAANPQTLLTVEEYLTLEQASEVRHEYYAGRIYAMAGASREHIIISANTLGDLTVQLRKRPCTAYGDDLRVKVSPTGLYTYPDITIGCEPAEFEPNPTYTLLNPLVIIEVLSPSTEAYDRGEKFSHYRTIDSLLEYVLIAQDRYRIAHYMRQENGFWLFKEVSGLDATLTLSSVGCTLTLADVYNKIDLSLQEELPR